jgi:protein-tyrosine phosphatase
VCLNEAYEVAERYPAYVEWLDANAQARAVWFPVPDLHAPPLHTLEPFLESLRRRLDDGATLLLHCGAGIGRAGTVAAALLITMGVPLDDALSVVASSRPAAGPQTAGQAELLAALAAAMSGRAPTS